MKPIEEEFGDEYTPERFGQKLKRHFRSAGHEVIHNALVLHYAARAPETPLWCKTAIYGSLGYLISLIDAIPDLTPILGYCDDLGVLVAAVIVLGQHITPEIRAKAKAKSDALFGSEPPTKIPWNFARGRGHTPKLTPYGQPDLHPPSE